MGENTTNDMTIEGTDMCKVNIVGVQIRLLALSAE
jgi:hypothetical protein